MMVSRLLIRMIHAIEKLVNATNKKRKESFDVYCPDDEPDEERDGGDQPGEDEDADESAEGPSASHPKRPPVRPGSSSKRARCAASKDVQSSLTMANLFWHDLNTIWHRVAVM